MSSHSSGSSSAPPPPTPTTGSGGGKGKVISAIKWAMFLIALITLAIGVSFSAGGLKTIGIVIAGLIALVVLLSIVGSGGGVGWGTVIISMIAASAVFILWAENTKKVQAGRGASLQQGGGTTITSPSGVVEDKVLAYPGTNYTSFTVGTGTNMWWIVEHPSESIMFHFDGGSLEHDQEDSKNGPAIRLPQMKREYTAHLRAKGIVSVPVKVYLTPIR